MKRVERNKAVALRSTGMSIREIAKDLDVAKASVSVWVREIKLTNKQKQKITAKGVSVEVVERRRTTRLLRTEKRRDFVMQSAANMLGKLTKRDLWIAGTALYWGEGSKTNKGAARVANSDPAVIALMMRYFRVVCGVSEAKFRGHVHTFSHLNADRAEQYWSEVSGIPRSQFYKTYVKSSVASKNKKDSLPYGTFDIYVNDTKLFLTIMGWIKKLSSA